MFISQDIVQINAVSGFIKSSTGQLTAVVTKINAKPTWKLARCQYTDGFLKEV